MSHTITRRELGAALAAVPAAISAQTARAQDSAPALPANPAEELAAVREQLKKNSVELAKFALPMSTEPAFHFKP